MAKKFILTVFTIFFAFGLLAISLISGERAFETIEADAAQSDVVTYSKASDGNTYLSKNFQVKEFACNDGSDKILIDPELVVILQTIRDHFGASITITSAYRSPAYNASIGGASNSYHTKGMAADIVVSGVSPNDVAKYAETIGVRGVGRYSTSSDGYFCHVDTRASKSYWIGQSSTYTSTHGGSYNTQPYVWPVLDQGITSTELLALGAKGNGVKQLQMSLNILINAGLAVDGDFGAGTETAVKNFQAQYGLKVDGMVGAETIAFINNLLKNGNTTISVTGVSLNKSSISLTAGDTNASLVATVSPSNATNKNITFSSNNTAVATVDNGGKVTAVSAGTAVITVRTADGGKTATCTVTVSAKQTSTETDAYSQGITHTSELLAVGAVGEGVKELQASLNKLMNAGLAVDGYFGAGTETALKNFQAQYGLTADGMAGPATFSLINDLIRNGGSNVSVTGVSLNKSSLTLTEGDTNTSLVATISPNNATNKTVTFSSNNTSIATVDNNGKVTAVSAGTAVITVRTSDGGKTATCTVTVSARVYTVTGVSLNRNSMSLTEGDTYTFLLATISPNNATNKTVTFSSNNTSVATVDNNGKVTAISAGTAVITVRTADGGKTATCTVTVSARVYTVTGVSLNKSSLSLTADDTYTSLVATVSPSNATNKAVTFSSNNTSVATVDNNGKITAISAGTAVITVRTADGGKTATCTVTVSARGNQGADVTELFHLTLTVPNGNGTVAFGNGSTSIDCEAGQVVSFTVTPDQGYYAQEIFVNGVTLAVENEGGTYVYTHTMPSEDCTIVVNFVADDTSDEMSDLLIIIMEIKLLIENCEPSDYTNWIVIVTAYEQAQSVCDQENVSKQDLSDAKLNLLLAQENLTAKEVDLSQLIIIIKQVHEKDKENYTPESWNTLTNALKNAQRSYSLQSEVNSAEVELTTALNTLVEKEPSDASPIVALVIIGGVVVLFFVILTVCVVKSKKKRKKSRAR